MATPPRALIAVASATLLALGLSGANPEESSRTTRAASTYAPTSHSGTDDGATPAPADGQPLRGKVIVIDPGHQLGNSRHLTQINRLVNAGGFRKACNTTGTATNGGFPEATFTWRLSRVLQAQLRARGASVYLTRHTNLYDDWGPCIDVRGRMGNRVHADAVVSIHGDGAASRVHGFFVIRPGLRRRWTGDIVRSSRLLARHVHHGLVAAGAHVSNSYGPRGYDVRTDLGTLNWSDVPIVMVELGNMRNRTDARRMTRPRYRAHVYADGLRRGVSTFVHRDSAAAKPRGLPR